MRNLNRAKFLVVVLALAMFTAGCPDAYTSSMQGSKDVSDAVSEVIPVLQQVTQDNLISQQQRNDVLGYLAKVTEGNQAFRASVKQIHTSGQTGTQAYLNAADTFVKAVQTQQIVGLPAKLQPYLTAVDTAIHGIELAISKAKGAK